MLVGKCITTSKRKSFSNPGHVQRDFIYSEQKEY